jgi:hypothetical protein
MGDVMGFHAGLTGADDDDVCVAVDQGLTLVHFSAQREHFLSHVVECFAGFSDTNGSG